MPPCLPSMAVRPVSRLIHARLFPTFPIPVSYENEYVLVSENRNVPISFYFHVFARILCRASNPAACVTELNCSSGGVLFLSISIMAAFTASRYQSHKARTLQVVRNNPGRGGVIVDDQHLRPRSSACALHADRASTGPAFSSCVFMSSLLVFLDQGQDLLILKRPGQFLERSGKRPIFNIHCLQM